MGFVDVPDFDTIIFDNIGSQPHITHKTDNNPNEEMHVYLATSFDLRR